MREEYDFSSAVRGKYAERFRDGVRFAETPPVQALMYEDLLHWVGAALREVQQVEVFLASFLALERRLSPSDAVKAAMDGLRTAEDVSAFWSESSSADEDEVSRLLRRFVPFRSWLVHSSLHCLVPELDQPDLLATRSNGSRPRRILHRPCAVGWPSSPGSAPERSSPRPTSARRSSGK